MKTRLGREGSDRVHLGCPDLLSKKASPRSNRHRVKDMPTKNLTDRTHFLLVLAAVQPLVKPAKNHLRTSLAEHVLLDPSPALQFTESGPDSFLSFFGVFEPCDAGSFPVILSHLVQVGPAPEHQGNPQHLRRSRCLLNALPIKPGRLEAPFKRSVTYL